MGEISLQINTQKTKARQFIQRGRFAQGDTLRLRRQELSFDNRFINDAEERAQLEKKTALALIDMNIATIAFYGIQLV